MIKIEVPSRIHLGLFEMSGTGYRQNGGIGFSVSDLDLILECEKSAFMEIIDERQVGFNSADLSRLTDVLNSVKSRSGLKKNAKFKITGKMNSHMGFGSGTAATLAALESLFILNDRPISNFELIRLSNRGGTSGIGIHSYFLSGLIIDLGRTNGNIYKPSSEWERPDFPKTFLRAEVPNWAMIALVPSSATQISKLDEINFFKRTVPIAMESVEKAVYIGLMGAFAAAKETNFDAFTHSINALQKSEWKDAEWNLHGPTLLDFKDRLLKKGADAVALSSLGPLLIAFFPKDSQLSDLELQKPQFTLARKVKVNNRGRRVTIY